MSNSIISARAFEFAVRIVKLADGISSSRPAARHVATQLVQAGTSVGANAEEAQEAQTKADFIARLSISRKEARETHYWLRLAVRSGIVADSQVRWELNEAAELLAMIRSAIIRARRSPTRGAGTI